MDSFKTIPLILGTLTLGALNKHSIEGEMQWGSWGDMF